MEYPPDPTRMHEAKVYIYGSKMFPAGRSRMQVGRFTTTSLLEERLDGGMRSRFAQHVQVKVVALNLVFQNHNSRVLLF